MPFGVPALADRQNPIGDRDVRSKFAVARHACHLPLRLCFVSIAPQLLRENVSEHWGGRLLENAETLSFPGAGVAREPAIQEHAPEKSMAWPVCMVSGPGPDGPSRNDGRLLQHPARLEAQHRLGED